MLRYLPQKFPNCFEAGYVYQVYGVCNTVHFGYSGHLGPPLSGHYIRTKYNRTNVFCPMKSGHYIRMAAINVATITGVHCSHKSHTLAQGKFAVRQGKQREFENEI